MFSFVLKSIDRFWWFLDGNLSVSTILKSSHELDRKRKEIQELLSVMFFVLNQISPEDFTSGVFEDLHKKHYGMLESSGDNFRWKIEIENKKPVRISLVLHGSVLFSYHADGKFSKLNHRHVGNVHFRLQRLVNQMVEQVNGFEYELKHFVNAHKAIYN